MRIQHNIAAMNSYRQLGGNNSALSKNLEKLSSGYRVNRAGDDAAGLAISEKMRAQIKGLSTAKKNASDGISMIQTAEGALTEVHSMLNRMEELITQSANGIYGTKERTEIKNELTALTEEIDRIADETNFNDIKLFDKAGTKDDAAAGTITLQISDQTGTTGQLKVKQFGLSAAKLGLAFDTAQADGSALDGAVVDGKISVADSANATKSLKNVKNAIERVSHIRGEYGAQQNRLEHTIDNLGTAVENITAAEARIRDTDMADEMMAFTKNNILMQASQAMLAQANQVPQGILQLLQ